jgi:hypothetical protein
MKNRAKRGTGVPARPPDDPEQAKRFEETARELDVDDGGNLFKRAMGCVVKRPSKKKTGG